MTQKTLIFDLGGVLLDWDPRYFYTSIFPNDPDHMEWFLREVCSPAWNEAQDQGRPLAEGTSFLTRQFPEYRHQIEMYYTHWLEMLKGPIEPNVAVLKELHSQKTPLYALTNFACDNLALCYERFDFFSLFKDLVVSGEEKLIKPDPRFYKILLERHRLNPTDCIFIDDRMVNLITAKEFGITTVLYKPGVNLRQILCDLEVLPG